MFRNFLQRLFSNKFWRRVSFNELSELYISSMLRNLALSLVGIFVPIYLYMLDYAIGEILIYMALVALIRVITDPLAGWLVGRIGPKHTILQSYWVQIAALVLLLTLPTMGWPLWLIASVWALSSGLFFVAYHTDFSAIEHADKEGKELGYLGIVERVGGVLGPLIGGLLATFVGPHITIGAAIVFFAAASIPLFLTIEPIPRQKHLNYSEVPVDEVKKHLFAYVSLNIESQLTMALWPLYVAVFIFLENTYASVGIVMSISFATAIIATYAMGKLVDQRKGGQLLKWGAITNALVHLARPFVQGFQGVLGLNILNDIINPAYRMPFLKGLYDTINLKPQARIAHIVVLEVVGALGKGSLWLILWLLVAATSPQFAMLSGFVLAAFASLGIMLHRFTALRS